MKNYKYLFLVAIFASLAFTSCSDDDDNDNLPEIVNEFEEITTVILTLSAEGSDDLVFLIQDLDGDGPIPPVESFPAQNLQANTTYTGVIATWNEGVDPVSNETEDIIEEADVHQFFYTPGGEFNFAEFNYTDVDSNGLPLGVEFNFTTGEAQDGSITVILRHDLTKTFENDPTDVGGETEVEVTFPIVVE